jgi:hypothetical protein
MKRVSPEQPPILENAAYSNFSKQPLIFKRDYYEKLEYAYELEIAVKK